MKITKKAGETNPFNTKEWNDFLRKKAEEFGITYEEMIDLLSAMDREEFEIIQDTFLHNYNRIKNG
jgi:hypothetical protein